MDLNWFWTNIFNQNSNEEEAENVHIHQSYWSCHSWLCQRCQEQPGPAESVATGPASRPARAPAHRRRPPAPSPSWFLNGKQRRHQRAELTERWFPTQTVGVWSHRLTASTRWPSFEKALTFTEAWSLILSYNATPARIQSTRTKTPVNNYTPRALRKAGDSGGSFT